MEQGDLMEILGNVLDNAFKWAATRISLSACKVKDGPQGSRLVLQVEDDGPGIPDDDTRDVLQRGVRADQSMPGHGVGLATVSGIVAEYGGVLTLSSGREGGARISMVFPDH